MQNVKSLVQNLIDDKISPDEFTKRLQIELNSSPQPYLVPFLEVSISTFWYLPTCFRFLFIQYCDRCIIDLLLSGEIR